MSDENVEQLCKDYAEYLKLHLTQEMNPVEDVTEELLTRLEEFENLVCMVKLETGSNCLTSIPHVVELVDELNTLFERIDNLEQFIGKVKDNLDDLENHVDIAEQEIESDGKLMNILKPLFFSKKSDLPSSHIRRYEAPDIFKTKDFFPSKDPDDK